MQFKFALNHEIIKLAKRHSLTPTNMQTVIKHELSYEIQTSEIKDKVWIHASDGSTVGRFSKMGVDLHNTITEQLNGAPQCRLCTHRRATTKDWALFREKALEWWGVEVPLDSINKSLLLDD